jgi:hypothetical protein
MASISELVILLTAKDHASAEFQKVSDKFKNVGAQMQKTGAAMSVAITAPFVLFAKDAIEGASSTEESLNKVRVVFGETAGEIEAFAKNAAKNLGMSNQSALEAAGTFGNLFDALGLGGPQATKMSKSILTLAADLASFNNIDPTEALEKLRSGLVGEAEPLRALGVNLNEAAVKAKAMQLGLGAAGRELTDAEKVTARYALIVDQTKNAQGDFARTADGLANSQRTAKAEAADLSAKMGKSLLPLMEEGTKLVRGLMERFMTLSPQVRTGILAFVGLVAVLGPLLIVLGSIITIAPAVGAAFMLLTGPIGLIVLAITLLALVWATNLGDIQGKTQTVIGFLQDLFDGFKLFVLQLWRGIVTGIANAVNGIIGVINGFIGAYNELASKLGLPLLGTISLITPNLDAVDKAISDVAKDREARLTVRIGYIDPGPPALGRTYALGTDHITRGPEFFLAGEAGPERVTVTPLAHGTGGMGGGRGGDVHIHFEGPVYGMQDFEEKVASIFRDRRLRGGFRGI